MRELVRTKAEPLLKYIGKNCTETVCETVCEGLVEGLVEGLPAWSRARSIDLRPPLNLLAVSFIRPYYEILCFLRFLLATVVLRDQ